ncbi:MAG: sigma-70 family RNA polymerase sigma factor [Clostridia bacterium]|nr:sigma-70 family RNA polymerase sigma factor [Clostridia bacterium]
MLIIPVAILAIESEDDRSFMTGIYTKYRALMLKVAWSFFDAKPDVEDIVTESCVALIRKIDRLKTMTDNEMRRYIVITVKNTATNLWNKKHREGIKFLSIDEEVLEQLPDESSFEGKILFEEELNHVRNAIHGLPEREQRILQMKFMDGKNDREIGMILGTTESNVRKIIERTRKRLKLTVYKGAVV